MWFLSCYISLGCAPSNRRFNMVGCFSGEGPNLTSGPLELYSSHLCFLYRRGYESRGLSVLGWNEQSKTIIAMSEGRRPASPVVQAEGGS